MFIYIDMVIDNFLGFCILVFCLKGTRNVFMILKYYVDFYIIKVIILVY